ncbi:MAG TPA: DUF3108 domain-containing protein [Ignavibacteria bacterium]|nr:DUF3108 domain-containing protein [Ignavibacteria bacterium]
MKCLILNLLLFLLCSQSIYSQNNILSEGEELNYVVYYGFIQLGEVRMKVTGKSVTGNETIYYSRSEMKSYKGIPFVSLNSVFESDMVFNGKNVFSKRFKAIEYKEEGDVIIEYKFNYDSNFVYVKKINNGKTEIDKNIPFNENVRFQDGLSLFYEARLDSYSGENFLIPVFMNETETSVNYYYSSKKEEISVTKFDNDINAIRCNGMANFEGVFGLTGEFAGWFSADDARVPVKSQLNVLIGNITLELDSYKRKGWILK